MVRAMVLWEGWFSGEVGGFWAWYLCGIGEDREMGCQEAMIGAGCEDVRALFLR